MKKLFSLLLLVCALSFLSLQSVNAQTYKIATDTTYAPFEWTNTANQLTGIDIDIMNAIAKDQGFTVEYQVLGFNAALQSLEAKQSHGVIAGMVITPERQQTFAMSQSYFEDSGLIIAVKPESTIQSLSDLKQQKVAVKIGTNGAKIAEKLAKVYGFERVTFEDSANMYQDVISGNSVAAFEDSSPMAYAIAQGNVNLKTIAIDQPKASYGFATTKGDPHGLVEKFNAGLANIKQNGIYAKIINNYFSGTNLAIDTTVYGKGETYTIATDTTFAPFVWQSVDGTLQGIDMAILNEIAKLQNVTFDIRALGFNAAIQALESQQVDGVMAGMSITPSRRQTFEFSTPYYSSGIGMAVAKDSSMTQYEALKNKKVAVKTGTKGMQLAEKLKEKYQFTINAFEDSVAMYQDVISGNSAAAFEDLAVMAYSIKDKGLPLKTIDLVEEVTDYGFAVLKGKNEELLNIFNAGLAQLKATGKFDAIIKQYVSVQNDKSETTVEDTSLVGIVQTNGMQLLAGLGQTLLLTLSAIVIALMIGVVLGLFSVSQNKGLQLIYTMYVDLMRGTPLMVLAFFIYFALPQLFNFQYQSPFLPSLMTLALNAAAYIGELFRGGIQSVDKGQFEASVSLGLPYRSTMRYIILPQAIKVMIPPFINQFVMTLKDTSILSAIGLVELTQTGKLIIARTYASTNTWIVVAALYICLITLLTKISKQLEKKWHM